jgi:hypothetical protein
LGQYGWLTQITSISLQELLSLLKLHKDKLERFCSIMNLQREIDTLAITIKHLQSGQYSSVIIKKIKGTGPGSCWWFEFLF